MEAYETLELDIGQKMKQADKDISALKVELEKEKLIRLQKEEYEEVATEINKYPSRQETQKEIENLTLEISKLKSETAAKEKELIQRQFGLFFHAAKILSTQTSDNSDIIMNGRNDLPKRRRDSEDTEMKSSP